LPYEEIKCHVKCQGVQKFFLGGKRFKKVFHKRTAKKSATITEDDNYTKQIFPSSMDELPALPGF